VGALLLLGAAVLQPVISKIETAASASAEREVFGERDMGLV
jgi:hypothetical protein